MISPEKMKLVPDYRAELKSIFAQRKLEFGRSFSMSKVAMACRVQKTYLSRVLNGGAHLTADQLYLVSRQLMLDANEENRIALLGEFGRCSLAERRRQLFQSIKEIEQMRKRTESHVTCSTIQSDNQNFTSEYYLTPEAQIVHIFLTVERYAKNTKLISKDLDMDEEQLAKLIRLLEKLGIIEFRGGMYHAVQHNLHLSKDSAVFLSHRVLVRLLAIEKLRKSKFSSTYTFSATLSANEKARSAIQEHFFNFLKEVEQIVKLAPSEEVYQLNFDLFPWSGSRA